MSIIPLHIQRRCERRWAARFSPSPGSARPRNQRPERESQLIGAGPEAAPMIFIVSAASHPRSELGESSRRNASQRSSSRFPTSPEIATLKDGLGIDLS